MARWDPLHVADLDADPMVQFARWFDEGTEMPDREAVALITATPEGAPSARMVLLRYRDATSVGWYTNYESVKGRQLAANPQAAVLWYCEPRGRQVRFEGPVAPMTPAESDAYFARRPRGHQLGAHASRQSEPLASRGELEARVIALEAEYEGRDVPRPANWGGYRLTPTVVEFWQQREDRLHDRVWYTRADGVWRIERRYP